MLNRRRFLARSAERSEPLHPCPWTWSQHASSHRRSRSTPDTATPFTLHPPHTPHTLHSTPFTLHPTPYTRYPTSYTRHPTPYTPTPSLQPSVQDHQFGNAPMDEEGLPLSQCLCMTTDMVSPGPFPLQTLLPLASPPRRSWSRSPPWSRVEGKS